MLFSLCFYIRYAATGLCNIFVFVLTWILLGSSGTGSNSDKLGSSDAAAFTVSTTRSIGPSTESCRESRGHRPFTQLKLLERACSSFFLGPMSHALDRLPYFEQGIIYIYFFFFFFFFA